MPDQRKEGKKLIGFYADEKELQLMQSAAAKRKETVADFLRFVAAKYGDPRNSHAKADNVKALKVQASRRKMRQPPQ